MATAARPRIRFSQRVHRRIRARQRLLLSAVLGLGVALAIPGPLPSAMRAAIGWERESGRDARSAHKFPPNFTCPAHALLLRGREPH